MEMSALTDAQWDMLRPLLPPQKPRAGRPAKDHRTVLDGILWVLRTGSPWLLARALRLLEDRFQLLLPGWQQGGMWDRVLGALQRRADMEGRLDWTLHFVDGTVVRAHQPAAGAKGGTRKPRRSGAAAAG